MTKEKVKEHLLELLQKHVGDEDKFTKGLLKQVRVNTLVEHASLVLWGAAITEKNEVFAIVAAYVSILLHGVIV